MTNPIIDIYLKPKPEFKNDLSRLKQEYLDYFDENFETLNTSGMDYQLIRQLFVFTISNRINALKSWRKKYGRNPDRVKSLEKKVV